MIYIPGGVFWRRWLDRMAEADKARELTERGCKFCGKEPVCPICGRCYDPNCNAGCYFCRELPEPRTCPCCGQEIH